MSFWVDHISNQVPSKQIKSQLCYLKHFVIQKTKNSWFSLQLFMRGPDKSILSLMEFHLLILRIIDIPSMKQNNANFGLFVGFPKFGGIIEICQIFLKGNETIQLFFEGAVELLIYRWENVFLKIQNMSNLDKNVSYPWRFRPPILSRKKLGDPLPQPQFLSAQIPTNEKISCWKLK